MKLNKGGFTFIILVYQHAYGNGSCGITIKKRNTVQYSYGGSYIGTPHNGKVRMDTKSGWRRLIPFTKLEKRD